MSAVLLSIPVNVLTSLSCYWASSIQVIWKNQDEKKAKTQPALSALGRRLAPI
ncbi:MAG: hypothetical protein ACN6QH_26940 [Pseudomonas sp.]|jgi:hypothetical protein|uniref:hypothetical protein n=1 Tax=Pseudomonas sp. TaxID=306 RepID=UPI003D0B8E17